MRASILLALLQKGELTLHEIQQTIKAKGTEGTVEQIKNELKVFLEKGIMRQKFQDGIFYYSVISSDKK